MSRAVFSLVLFLSSWWGTEPHSLPVTEGTITSILSWQLEGCRTCREPQPGLLVVPSCQGWDGLDNIFSSSSKYLDEDLAKLVDNILLQVFPSNPDRDGARTASGLITLRDVNETHLQPNSFNNSEFASSSYKQDEHLANLFDEILLQVFSNDPEYLSKEKAKRAGELVTWRDVNEGKYLTAEKKDKESFIFNRDVSHQLTTEHKGTLPEAISPAVKSKNDVSCRQLLSFLQKNITIAAFTVAAILMVTVFLMVILSRFMKQKQSEDPPASATYNIFIMNGKAWWQKSQEKHQRKFTGKQKQLKYNSYV